jgi:chromosome transmission fidelity protein 1
MSIDFGFPGQPYDVQVAFMNHAYQAMNAGGICVLESPTGTGKSLSLLCSAVSWLRDNRRSLVTDRLKSASGSQSEADDLPEWMVKNLDSSSASEANKICDGWDEFRTCVKKDAANVGVSLNGSSILNTGPRRKRAVPRSQVSADDTDEELLSDSEPSPGHSNESHSNMRPQVIICSRTHSQLAQLLNELKRVKDVDSFNVVLLGSRNQLCVHPSMPRNAGSSAVNDFCRQLVDKQGCEFKRGINPLTALITAQPMDIEEMRTRGSLDHICACPYYASRAALENADIVLVPYASLIQQKSRDALGLDLGGNVLIIDEAHNLLDTINSTRSCVVTAEELSKLSDSIKLYLETYSNRLSAKNLVLIKQVGFLSRKILTFLSASRVNYVTTIATFTFDCDILDLNLIGIASFLSSGSFARKLRGFTDRCKLGSPNAVYSLVAFLESVLSGGDADRIAMLYRSPESLPALSFACVDAEVRLTEIAKRARATLLVGGTMQPVEDIVSVCKLGHLPFSCFVGTPVIARDRVLCRTISSRSDGQPAEYTSSSRSDESLRRLVLDTIETACSSVLHGGIVLFVSSYEFARSLSPIVRESCMAKNTAFFADTESVECERLLFRYKESISIGHRSLLLSIVNGRLSEGIDFRDDLCRCLILVGLPYPNKGDPILQERMAFLDRRRGEDATCFSGNRYYQVCKLIYIHRIA